MRDMRILHNHILINLYIAAGILMAAALCGCSHEVSYYNEVSDSRNVYVTATLAENIASRQYQESGPVESGIYYLAYPDMSKLEYALGTVNFNLSEARASELSLFLTITN